MLPLLDSAIEHSKLLIELLRADELDIDAIAKLEVERREYIYQLFNKYTPEQLSQESAALRTLQQLDKNVVESVANKKVFLGQQLLQLKRGKANATAYKLNKF